MICIKIKSGEKSMIKIAICDDEKTMCEYLEQKVSEILKKWNISIEAIPDIRKMLYRCFGMFSKWFII